MTIAQNKPVVPFAESAKIVSHWTIAHPDQSDPLYLGDCRHYIGNVRFNNRHNVAYTEAQLAQRHPSISVLLDALLNWPMTEISHAIITNSLLLWESSLLSLPSHALDAGVEAVSHVGGFLNLQYKNDGASHVRLEYRYFSTAQTADGLVYAKNSGFGRRYVLVDWLDTTYPGWEDRHTTATALGLDTTQVAQYVLSAGHAVGCMPETNLPAMAL